MMVFSTAAICMATRGVPRGPASPRLCHSCYFLCFDNGHLNACEVASLGVFLCVSLVMSQGNHVFIVSILQCTLQMFVSAPPTIIAIYTHMCLHTAFCFSPSVITSGLVLQHSASDVFCRKSHY
jgi:hypothetical protein